MSKPAPGGGRELAVVLVASALLAVAFTYPLAFRLGTSGRVDNGDGQFSIWNVAWVARTLVVDPAHVFDANIFYPHRSTLAYSESNIGAGILAIPGYWATRNPYFAHNTVVLLMFALALVGMYYLVRYLTQDRRAAAVSAICFAFCPYIFARTAHIQLLMTAGMPFSLLAFHRMVDRPTIRTGATLGAVMAAQAVCCGYYGVFVMLMVGYGVLVVATTRRRWSDRAYWTAVTVGAVLSIALVAPFFVPYFLLQQSTGFGRSIAQAREYRADWAAYLASSAYAHAWLLAYLREWREVLFPGAVATLLGAWGAWVAARSRTKELAVIYVGLVVLAAWASFGPDAVLYTVLYETVPAFGWMRAPARFGLIVVFGLSVLAGIGLSALLARVKRPRAVAGVVVAAALVELAVPFPIVDVPAVPVAYQALAQAQPGPVVEMPFFYTRTEYFRHSEYMLNSTRHWMPLVNGYSDYVPDDFADRVATLAPFPSQGAFKYLEPLHARYAMFHMRYYNEENRQDVLRRLAEFAPYLHPIHIDEDLRLYEITGFPP